MKIRILETQEFRSKIKETSAIQSYGNTPSKPTQLGCGLSGEKSISDPCTFKAKEDEGYLQRVLSSPHNPGFTELDPCPSIYFHTLYNCTATHRA